MSKQLLIVSNFLSGAGGSRGVCEELAMRLPQCGWHVQTTSCVRNKMLRLYDMLRSISRRAPRIQVAQVDIFSGAAFLWADWTTRKLQRLGVPIVLALHGGNLSYFAQRQPNRVRRVLARANGIVAPSPYLADSLQQLAPCEIQTIPNAIELARYPFRARRGLGREIVWLRAFHEIYNPALALAIVKQLLPVYPELQLTMVGPDKGARPSLVRALDAHGLQDHVQLHDAIPKSEVPRMLRTAEIFLNTSDVDNYPVSVLEAMACGLCVTSSKVGGLSHLIDHGKTGLLAPASDINAFAANIHHIFQNPILADTLSSGARAFAQTHDWATILPQWDHLLTRAASHSQS